MDILPSKMIKIILCYENCQSIEMRTDKIKKHGEEWKKIINAATVIEEECKHQSLDKFNRY